MLNEEIEKINGIMEMDKNKEYSSENHTLFIEDVAEKKSFGR